MQKTVKLVSITTEECTEVIADSLTPEQEKQIREILTPKPEPKFKEGQYCVAEGEYFQVVAVDRSIDITTFRNLQHGWVFAGATDRYTAVLANDVVLDFGNGIKGTVKGQYNHGGWFEVYDNDNHASAIFRCGKLADPMKSTVEALLKEIEEEN